MCDISDFTNENMGLTLFCTLHLAKENKLFLIA